MRVGLSLRVVGLIGVLGLLPAAGCGNSPSVAPGAQPEGEPKTTAGVPDPSGTADSLDPFPVRSHLQFGPQDEFLGSGLMVTGRTAAPVNTKEPDRDFFTGPEFDKGDNSGRLFHVRFLLSKSRKGKDPALTLSYICWQPLNAHSTMAQLLYPRPGTDTGEVTTDGKKLFVPHDPLAGKGQRQVDVYAWSGDAQGKGRFVLEGTPPELKLPVPTK